MSSADERSSEDRDRKAPDTHKATPNGDPGIGAHQVLEDGFTYICDRGDVCVILVELEQLSVGPGDQLSIGENGEEGTYLISSMLPLDHRCSELRHPVGVVLIDQDPYWAAWGHRSMIAEFRSKILGFDEVQFEPEGRLKAAREVAR